jgi:hypothetical protein
MQEKILDSWFTPVPLTSIISNAGVGAGAFEAWVF